MTVRYHIWGEGPSDVGRVHPDGTRAEEGCIDGLLRRATPSRIEISCKRAGTFRELKKLPGPRKKKLHGLKGFARNAYVATREAIFENADWLVLATDTDRESGMRRQRELRGLCLRKREEMAEGYARALRDGVSTSAAEGSIEVPALIRAVPLRKLESWLIADLRTFERVMEEPRPRLPKPPEELGGATDAKGLLRDLGVSAEKLLALARAADPRVLRKECSVSYPPFHEDVRLAAGRRPGT